jgi:hypothetical protein
MWKTIVLCASLFVFTSLTIDALERHQRGSRWRAVGALSLWLVGAVLTISRPVDARTHRVRAAYPLPRSPSAG